MRSYCPEILVHLIFHILGLILSDCFFIWHVHGYGWEDSWKARYAQSNHWRPPQGPLNSPKIYIFFLHFGSYMKNWFSNCFPLYICLHCDDGCIWWHFGAPGTPGFYVRAQHDPEKKVKNIFFFFLNQKVFIISWWGLHDTLVPLDSTYGSPGSPKNHQITSIFYMLLEDSLIWSEINFKNLHGALKHIYKMFMSSVDPCILI